MDTVWVLGDQLNRRLGALRNREPGEVRVLIVHSARSWRRSDGTRSVRTSR